MRNYKSKKTHLLEPNKLFFHEESGRYLLLYHGMIMGRAIGNERFENDLLMSSQHAAIRVIRGRVFIEDLGSTNGTRINERKIVQRKPVRLREDDQVRIGNQRFVYRTDYKKRFRSLPFPSAQSPQPQNWKDYWDYFIDFPDWKIPSWLFFSLFWVLLSLSLILTDEGKRLDVRQIVLKFFVLFVPSLVSTFVARTVIERQSIWMIRILLILSNLVLNLGLILLVLASLAPFIARKL